MSEREHMLERALAARDKTIAVLLARLDRRASDLAPGALLERSIAFEEIVARKTAALTHALGELQVAHSTMLQSSKLEAIGRLAAGIAHEINTPAQYVSDNLSFLRSAWNEDRDDAFVAEQVPSAIEQSLAGVARIAEIVRALQDLARPSNGATTAVDLDELIRTTVTVATNEWKYAADVALDLDPTLPPVPCVRDRIAEVFLGLIVNAAHAIAERGTTAGKGTIRIVTRRDDVSATIAFHDDGAGIRDDVRAHLFEPFFTTKPIGKGTGQGLAIARAVVVEQHRGAIDVVSTVGVGTCFTLRLPLEAQP